MPFTGIKDDDEACAALVILVNCIRRHQNPVVGRRCEPEFSSQLRPEKYEKYNKHDFKKS